MTVLFQYIKLYKFVYQSVKMFYSKKNLSSFLVNIDRKTYKKPQILCMHGNTHYICAWRTHITHMHDGWRAHGNIH